MPKDEKPMMTTSSLNEEAAIVGAFKANSEEEERN